MEEMATIILVMIIGFLFCCAGGLILGVVLSPLFLVLWIIKQKRNKKVYKVVFQKSSQDNSQVHIMQNLNYNQLSMVKKAIIRKGFKIAEVSNG